MLENPHTSELFVTYLDYVCRIERGVGNGVEEVVEEKECNHSMSSLNIVILSKSSVCVSRHPKSALTRVNTLFKIVQQTYDVSMPLADIKKRVRRPMRSTINAPPQTAENQLKI